jgi:hypothetical protein
MSTTTRRTIPANRPGKPSMAAGAAVDRASDASMSSYFRWMTGHA